MELSPIVFYAILLLLSTLVVKTIFSIKNQRDHLRRRPPGPFGLPLIGHLHLLGPRVHHSLHEFSSRYGPFFHIRLGSTQCFVVSTPELAKEFLKTHELNFSSRKLSAAIKLLTYDVSFAFAPYGPYWRFIKKLFTNELLGTRTMNQFRPVRALEIRQFMKHLTNKAKHGDTINVTEELLTLANNVISQMMLGIRYSENEVAADEARTVVREVTQIFGEFDISDVLWFCRDLDLQGIKKRSQEIHGRYDVLLEKLITGKEIQRNKKVHTKLDGDAEAESLLDILLDVMENGNSDVKLTRDSIKAIILDFFTAATDTTAISIEWALAELINNPDVLKKAQDEIDKVVGHNRLVEETDGPNLPYIQAIIKETYRLHPPIPLLTRKSVNECTVNGYNIPTNALLFVNIWSIGRNPKVWSRPMDFSPERFYDLSKGTDQARTMDFKGQHFELLPFGTGRRGCPGMSLAMQEVPTVLAAIVQCFDFKVLDLHGEKTNVVDMTERPGLTAPRAHDLMCKLVPRIDLASILFDS